MEAGVACVFIRGFSFINGHQNIHSIRCGDFAASFSFLHLYCPDIPYAHSPCRVRERCSRSKISWKVVYVAMVAVPPPITAAVTAVVVVMVA